MRSVRHYEVVEMSSHSLCATWWLGIAGDTLTCLGGDGNIYREYNYARGRDKKTVERKISRFLKIRDEIDRRGYDYSRGYITVASCGARLNGSHRAAILHHLDYESIDVVMVKMKTPPWLLKHLEEQRRAYC